MKTELTQPLLSLILCTVGRTVELIEFLNSVLPGSEKVQLIIVDQNESSLFVKSFLESYPSKFHSIIYIHEEKKSLSWARNIGLKAARGRFIGYPDDDCVYVNDLLSSLVELLDASSCDDNNFKGVTIGFPGCKKLEHRQHISALNLPGRAISFSFFVKVDKCSEILFREDLGVGNFYGAAEETEYLLRVLGSNGYLEAYPEYHVQHPEKSNKDYEREINYGKGFGALAYLYFKNIGFSSLFVVMKIMIGPYIKSILLLVTLQFRAAFLSIVSAFSRFIGFIAFACRYKRIN